MSDAGGTPGAERLALGAIAAASAAAIGFLLWLLYVHDPAPALAEQWAFLPQLNALLNGLSAIALCVGFYFIKQGDWRAHRASMLMAFACSSLFLISYIVNHALRGDTLFPGTGTARAVYLSILASHIVLSIVALPMVLATFFFALSDRLDRHRRLARVTFPVWLYVSVTGVVVFVFLKAYAR
jgi:putative membrane protein